MLWRKCNWDGFSLRVLRFHTVYIIPLLLHTGLRLEMTTWNWPAHGYWIVRNSWVCARLTVECQTDSDHHKLSLNSWFQTFALLWKLYFLGWIPSVWILYADVSEHSICPIFTGRVNKKILLVHTTFADGTDSVPKRRHPFLFTRPMKMEHTVFPNIST
jgi:hypothetical protein